MRRGSNRQRRPRTGLQEACISAIFLSSALTACAAGPAPTESASTAPSSTKPQKSDTGGLVEATAESTLASPVVAFASSGNAAMDAWRDRFAARAVADGRQPEIVRLVLADIEPLTLYLGDEYTEPRTGIADQAEFAKPIWEYIESAVSESRLQRGAVKLQELSDTFDEIEARFGVDRQVLAAIWAMETNLGSYIGNFDAANTLANMAVEGRRQALAEGELLALIKMLERGDVRREQLVSGWAGAMGHTQFMPTTFLSYALDFDSDGRKDIWDSPADALASAANYLAASGYRSGQPWGLEVIAPSGFDWSLADGEERSMSVWKSEGLSRINGRPFPVPESLDAELWLPAGAKGPKFLLFANFEVFKTYNRSDSYALAVGLLADGMVGEVGPIGVWPKDLGRLNSQQVMDLQAGLNQLGYDAGIVDGIAGRGTKSALRAFQIDYGLLADGYPTAAVLDYVLSAAR